MKGIIRLGLALLLTSVALAQKETFDVLSYVVPRGWQQRTTDRGVQLSVTDKATNGYALAILTPATPAPGTAAENFQTQWANLVLGSVTAAGDPTLAAPAQSNGWDIVSGSGNYTDQGVRGMAILLSATGHGRTVSVILMTNSQQFQNELGTLLQSLVLAAPATSATPVNSPLTGKIWEGTTTEKFTTGSLNGHNTGGFFKGQYRFNPDGTYHFVRVGASASVETNQLQRESGTYAVSGNQLTITPVSSTVEEWSVAGGPIRLAGMSDVQIREIKDSWSTRLKTTEAKREKVTYAFRIEYQAGNHADALILEYGNGHTEREGSGRIAYYFETAAEKSAKLPANMAVSPVSPPAAPVAAPTNAPAGLPGLWVYYNVETNGTFSNGTPMYTAGYFRREYLIKPDGTYVFRLKNWSVYVKNICFAAEIGTWTVSGNQITLTPMESLGGWWAKAASGRTTEWGPRVEPTEWKRETVTYTYELTYYSGMQETHLLLTHAQPTARDGTANPANYSPRALDKSLIDNPPQ